MTSPVSLPAVIEPEVLENWKRLGLTEERLVELHRTGRALYTANGKPLNKQDWHHLVREAYGPGLNADDIADIMMNFELWL